MVGKFGVTCMCALNVWRYESSNNYGNQGDCRNASQRSEKKCVNVVQIERQEGLMAGSASKH